MRKLSPIAVFLAGLALGWFEPWSTPEPVTLTKIVYVDKQAPDLPTSVPVPERITIYDTLTEITYIEIPVPVLDDKARIGIIPVNRITGAPIFKVNRGVLKLSIYDPEALRYKEFTYRIAPKRTGIYLGVAALFTDVGISPAITATYDAHWRRFRLDVTATAGTRGVGAKVGVGVRL